jgi:ketosteroid isomerase-like protein
MAGELEKTVRDFMKQVDTDFAKVTNMVTDDFQGVDELSRHWMRGKKAVEDYVKNIASQISDIHSEVTDLREMASGELGIVTCWIEQDYKYGGEKTHISAPTTFVLRRAGPAWKVALFSSIPLPEAG